MTTKILIIEDENALASVLSVKLVKAGYDVAISVNGEDGLAKINAWQPDLILLDIVMPKMNGYEVLENLNKNNIKIPVIIISNSGQDIEIEKTKKLGALDSIVKTEINPEEVVEKVGKILNKSFVSGKKAPTEIVESDKGQGVRVLLVEDDSFLRDICYKKLKKEGFNVSIAADGEQAIKSAESFLPEIILLDIILPSIDGFEVLKKIRASKNKAVKNVPVIILTNLGQEEDIKKAMSLGATDYLIKAHFTTEEIVKKVKDKLGMK